MSGHSKWATTKHKKAVVDAKRSRPGARIEVEQEQVGGRGLSGERRRIDRDRVIAVLAQPVGVAARIGLGVKAAIAHAAGEGKALRLWRDRQRQGALGE